MIARLAAALLLALACVAPARAEGDVNSVRYLHGGQLEVLQHPARFRYVVCGRGWGKTHDGIADSLRAITTDPRAKRAGSTYLALYVGPTRNQVREIAWEWFKQEIPPEWLLKKPNETLLEFRFAWGPTLRLVGADKLRSRRGLTVNHLVADEFAHMREGIWSVLRPTLRTPQDRALIITTPNGPNHAFDLWNKVQRLPGWMHWQKPTWTSPYHDRQIVEEARHTLSRLEFDQEYGASFMALRGAVYGDFSADPRGNVPLEPIRLDPDREVFVGQDYNGGHYSAVICQQRGSAGLDQVGELVTRGSLIAHREGLKKKLVAAGVRPAAIRTQVTVCADNSGAYNQTSAADDADNSVMREVFSVVGTKRNPLVNERVLTVQALILNAAGERRLRVSPECTETIHCLMNQVWNRWGKPDKTKGLDHVPDALGYAAHWLFPIDRAPGVRSRSA